MVTAFATLTYSTREVVQGVEVDADQRDIPYHMASCSVYHIARMHPYFT